MSPEKKICVDLLNMSDSDTCQQMDRRVEWAKNNRSRINAQKRERYWLITQSHFKRRKTNI